VNKNGLGFYEFFAGGGMTRLGLGRKWRCLLANDICQKKARAYRMNFRRADELIVRDVAELSLTDLPGTPDLAWASFPCQDLSLAGNRGGLQATRSGTFWPFWSLIQQLTREGRPPSVVVLENVVGAITSHKGRDFHAIVKAMVRAGYRVGSMVIDAVHFVPQSRKRLFVVAVHTDAAVSHELLETTPTPLWHPKVLTDAYHSLPERLQHAWVWWRLPAPPSRRATLTHLIEKNPTGVPWRSVKETKHLLDQMSQINRKKVREAKALRKRIVGTVYRRTRHDESGRKVQRAEVRFDQISGCLRTPVGGSSRQTILVVDGANVRSRLLSTREAARLMGLPDTYKLPDNYNEAYHLVGDGVVVPVVAWLEKHLLSPLALLHRRLGKAA